jgi:hypothetical protein
LKGLGREPVLPFNPAPYLTDWLLEIGPSIPAGDRAAAIGFSEMAAWSRLMGVDLSPWEARTLRRLSRAFVNQQSDASNPSCIEPMVKVDQETARKRVDDQFKSMMESLRAR